MPELRLVTPRPSPLALLRDVRDVMTAPGLPQERLDRLVQLIASRLESEVCSVYVLQPGQMLELYATAGLNAASVHNTRLAVGQGLVGEIAAEAMPLNLADAQAHPKFVYRPETGEERFQSFVGVPILTNHQVIGVLVVQSVRARSYSDDEMEVLQTIAMVLAELTVGQRLVDRTALAREKRVSGLSHAMVGEALSPGLAKAPAVLHRPQVEIKVLLAEDPDHEERRLRDAAEAMRSSVAALIESADTVSGEHADILETYRMLVGDEGWLNQIVGAIHTGLSAEAAVKKVLESLHVRLENARNAHVRRRIEDLEDVSTRLLYHLSGVSYSAAHLKLPDAFVLVAATLGPAELLEYGHERIKALVLCEGAAASHVTIIARMMDIPVVAGIKHATDVVAAGDTVIVDGDHGQVFVRPSDDLEQEIALQLAAKAARSAAHDAQRELPPVTKDGVRIALNLTIGLQINTQELAAADIAGVGLFRTELPYMAASNFPGVEAQKAIYRGVLQQAAGKPVVFRTFDIGGDKPVPYLTIPPEENPAMGWRAVRIALDRPFLLKRQLRALLEAAAGETLSVMFPMIATAEEFRAASAILAAERAALDAERRRGPRQVRVGVMFEVPSLLFELEAFLPELDFVSVGSNDLLQFLYAADRGNDELSRRYRDGRASTFRLLRQLVAQCDAAGVEIGFCGDMATRPLDAMALLACGFRSLSIPPRFIGPVKAMLLSLPLGELTGYLDFLLARKTGSLRASLEAWARDHAIRL